jgi:hypothetical protein
VRPTRDPQHSPAPYRNQADAVMGMFMYHLHVPHVPPGSLTCEPQTQPPLSVGARESAAGACTDRGAAGTSLLSDVLRYSWVPLRGSLGDAKSSLGDAKSSLGDAESSLGDAKRWLGAAKSSLGDT